MFQSDWLILRILHRSFEIERLKGHWSEVVVHLYIIIIIINNYSYSLYIQRVTHLAKQLNFIEGLYNLQKCKCKIQRLTTRIQNNTSMMEQFQTYIHGHTCAKRCYMCPERTVLPLSPCRYMKHICVLYLRNKHLSYLCSVEYLCEFLRYKGHKRIRS